MMKMIIIGAIIMGAFVVAAMRHPAEAGKPCRVDCPTPSTPPIVSPSL